MSNKIIKKLVNIIKPITTTFIDEWINHNKCEHVWECTYVLDKNSIGNRYISPTKPVHICSKCGVER